MSVPGLANFAPSIFRKAAICSERSRLFSPALQNVLAKLSAEGHLKGTDPAWFAKRAGFYLGEINAVHAFREGNGRAQREFIRELGLEARFMIDWSRATRDRMIAASRQSFETGDSSGLESLVLACIRD